jgi:hypothetical protein
MRTNGTIPLSVISQVERGMKMVYPSIREYIGIREYVMKDEVAGLTWPADRMLPAFQAPQHLHVYDIRGASPAAQLTATTLAGLVNRPQPQIYLIANDDDAFWLKQLFGSIPQDLAPVSGDGALEALLMAYRSSIHGLVMYDPALIDSVNIATMLASQRDGIVVSPPQAQDLQTAYHFSVLADLRTYHWRTRLQAYHWAQQNLLSGCSPRLVAGLDPNNTTGLRAFLVATRTFIYWLDSRIYVPDLSDGLLSERGLMQQIFSAFQSGAVHLGWFIDEGSGVGLASQAAIAVLASDHITNLEPWTAIEPRSTEARAQVIPQGEAPAAENKVYLSFTISDGDNLQYCQHRLLHIWNDSARGTLPIGWTISAALGQVMPAMVAYYVSTATPNDELIAGPSGAGYMFPSCWPDERLGPFLQLTGQLMRSMGLTTLEVLDSDLLRKSGLPVISNMSLTGMAFTDADDQQRFVQALTPFGLRGILSGAGLSVVSWKKVNGVPLYQNLGLAGSVSGALKLIRNATTITLKRPCFLNVYMLAWSISPSDLKQIVAQLGDGYEVVLPRTLLAMLARTM